MIIFYLALALFFSFPLIWIAIVFHSIYILILAGVASVAGSVWFNQTKFKRVNSHLLATKVVPGHSLFPAWTRVLESSGAENVSLDLWLYSVPSSECFYWVKTRSSGICFMSQGMASRLNENELARVFQKYLLEDHEKTKLENHLYALTLWWGNLKGTPKRFRYWFLSFFLYPFERLLKIAKI